jgi:hypothetical protein
LRCALGHRYGGRVRIVQDCGYDMDGDELWQAPRDDYDPLRCVVCGLLTWSREGPPPP